MQQRFYLDTCIWRDYHENRSDKFRPLGDWALRLINKLLENKNLIIISDITLMELRRKYSDKEIASMLSIVEDKKLLITVSVLKSQAAESANIFKKLKNIPASDILHAILARDNNAVIVTRDKHFYELLGIVQVKKPEELI